MNVRPLEVIFIKNNTQLVINKVSCSNTNKKSLPQSAFLYLLALCPLLETNTFKDRTEDNFKVKNRNYNETRGGTEKEPITKQITVTDIKSLHY